MITIGNRIALNTATGFRVVCLTLRPSMVVEFRGVHRELLDLDRVRIELVEQASYRFRPTVAGDAEGQVLLAVPARVGQDPHRGVEFEVTGEPEPDVTARDLALELAGSAV